MKDHTAKQIFEILSNRNRRIEYNPVFSKTVKGKSKRCVKNE